MLLTDEGVIAELQAGAMLLKRERYKLLVEIDQLKEDIRRLEKELADTDAGHQSKS